MSVSRALEITPDAYQRNRLHDPEMPWQETNCYADVWIELIHALGFEVEPCLGFTITADFEQDQWTFFKPPLQDIRELYGLRVEELTLWRSLSDQCIEQIAAGNLPLLEVDSYNLPDTAGTDYRRNHVKTTIAINEMDPAAETIAYFHSTGYHRLQGADFRGLFRLDRQSPADFLPPYCEIVKTVDLMRVPPTADKCLLLLKKHVNQRPTANPFNAFSATFDRHLEWISEGGLDTYHAYVFASLRQCGAAFDLGARHLQWLNPKCDIDLLASADAFTRISTVCKMLLLKLARIANGKPPGDFSASLDEMSTAWRVGFESLDDALDSAG